MAETLDELVAQARVHLPGANVRVEMYDHRRNKLVVTANGEEAFCPFGQGDIMIAVKICATKLRLGVRK